MLDRRLRRYVRHGMLTQLAAFEAVVRLRSFTRAAEALHMAQPTISLLVKKLGETLGIPLFESTTREIRLTPAGAEIYRFCQDFFQSFVGLDVRLNELRSGETQALRIAVCTAGESIVPMLRDFCRKHADIKLTLSVANRAQLRDRMTVGADDLYIFGAPPEDTDAHMHPLCMDEFHLYASVAHPYTRRRKLTLTDLAREPLLMREAGSGTRQAADALFAAQDFQPYIRMEMDNNEAIKRAVAAGFGIALLSRYAVGPNPRHEALAPLRIEGLPILRQWQLVYRADKVLSITERQLVDELCRQTMMPYGENTEAIKGRRKRKLFGGRGTAGPALEGTS